MVVKGRATPLSGGVCVAPCRLEAQVARCVVRWICVQPKQVAKPFPALACLGEEIFPELGKSDRARKWGLVSQV